MHSSLINDREVAKKHSGIPTEASQYFVSIHVLFAQLLNFHIWVWLQCITLMLNGKHVAMH